MICSRLAQHLSHRVNRSPRVSQDSHPHIQDCMTHTPSLLLPSHLSTTSLSTCTPIRPSLLFPSHGDTPCDDPSNVSFGPLSEPHSPTVSVHAKQSSSQPVLARENFWDSRNFARNLTTTFQFVSRWIQTRQDTFHSAGARRTQTYRNTVLGNTTGASSGYDEQHCRSLHETSGWTENAVARKETLDLNPGPNGDD